METSTLGEKLERLRLKAELLLDEDKKTFIKDVYDSYYFCNILVVDEKHITFVPFKGKFKGVKITSYWVDLAEIKEYEGDDGDE